VRNAIKRAHRRGDRAAVRQLRKQLQGLPSGDTQDPGYRRLRYIRHADDQLLGLTGPKAEAEQIKARLAAFLHDDLKLEMSQEKTLITHARTGAARFLGYEITVQHANSRRLVNGRRPANGVIGLRVPKDVIKAKRAPYLKLGKPETRTRLVNEDDHAIVETFGAEYRGLVNFYLLAGDVWRLNRVHWVMRTSLLKTLACKHDSTVMKMATRHKAVIDTPHGPRKCLQAVVERTGKKPLTATFGGIPLKRQQKAVLDDRRPPPDVIIRRKELIKRLQAGRCEMCQRTGEVEAHQVGKLAHLGKPGKPRPAWAELMARKRRKTLVVCAACHDSIHHRRPTATPDTEQSLESRMIGNDHVRFGRRPSGKGPATLAPRPMAHLARRGLPRRPRPAPARRGRGGSTWECPTWRCCPPASSCPTPRHLDAAQRRLRSAARVMSRRAGPGRRAGTRPSKRWERACRRLARLHARAANLRRDGLHKLTTSLARGYGTVVVEDLNAARNLEHYVARSGRETRNGRGADQKTPPHRAGGCEASTPHRATGQDGDRPLATASCE
jgi:hypothetical protein